MLQQAKDYYKLVFDFNMELQRQIPAMQELLQTGMCLEEQADLHYAIHRAFEMLEETLKHMRVVENLSTKVLCLKWSLQSNGDNVKTDYVTATPQVTEMPKMPSEKSSPDEYRRMMADLGVPLDMVENDVVRPHWPGFKDMVHTLAEQGLPLPDGCDLTSSYPVYKVRLRKKKGVLETDD